MKFSSKRIIFAYCSPTQFCIPEGVNHNLTSCCFFQREHNVFAKLSSDSLFLFPKFLWKYFEVCYSCWARLMNCICLNSQSLSNIDFIFHLPIFSSRWWNKGFLLKQWLVQHKGHSLLQALIFYAVYLVLKFCEVSLCFFVFKHLELLLLQTGKAGYYCCT